MFLLSSVTFFLRVRAPLPLSCLHLSLFLSLISPRYLDIGKLGRVRFLSQCDYCGLSGYSAGACVECDRQRCTVMLHPMCAVRSGSHQIDGSRHGKGKLRLFCKKHAAQAKDSAESGVFDAGLASPFAPAVARACSSEWVGRLLRINWESDPVGAHALPPGAPVFMQPLPLILLLSATPPFPPSPLLQ